MELPPEDFAVADSASTEGGGRLGQLGRCRGGDQLPGQVELRYMLDYCLAMGEEGFNWQCSGVDTPPLSVEIGTEH